jgi:hypothetical protein
LPLAESDVEGSEFSPLPPVVQRQPVAKAEPPRSVPLWLPAIAILGVFVAAAVAAGLLATYVR